MPSESTQFDPSAIGRLNRLWPETFTSRGEFINAIANAQHGRGLDKYSDPESVRRLLAKFEKTGRITWGFLDVIASRLGRSRAQFRDYLAGQEAAPGGAPALANLPYNRNLNYTEAGQSLAGIRKLVMSGKRAAIYGLGGVGKTQLALEYAQRHQAEYRVLWWLRSDTRETLQADYAALAAALGLPEKNSRDPKAILQAVFQALSRRKDWLLVFDNAGAAGELGPFLPAGGGHTLITSQNPDWNRVATPVPVAKWSAEEAVEFLRKRTGPTDSVPGHNGRFDYEVARQMAVEMDGLPLALEQAGAFVTANGVSLKHYLELFRVARHQMPLLKTGAPPEHAQTVAAMWALALEQVKRQSPGAAALVRLCAFFAPEDIPREMILAGVRDFPGPWRTLVNDPVAFDTAVGMLRRYSLVEAQDGQALSMHRLVQCVARELPAPQSQRAGARQAARAVLQALAQFPLREPGNWALCDRILPHFLAVGAVVEAGGWQFHEPASVLAGFLPYLYARLAPEQIRKLLTEVSPATRIFCVPFTRRSVSRKEEARVVKRLQSRDDPEVVRKLEFVLGFQLLFRGAMNESEARFKAIVNHCRKQKTPATTEAALIALPLLATFALYRGDFAEAAALGEECLAQAPKAFIQPRGQALWVKAEARLRQGGFSAAACRTAEQTLQAAISACAAYPQAGMFCNASLGLVYAHRDRPDEALDYCQRARRGTEGRPFEAAFVYFYSGEVALRLGRPAEAQEWYKKARDLHNQTTADSERNVFNRCRCEFQLARTEFEQGHPAAARNQLRRVRREVRQYAYQRYFDYWKKSAPAAFRDFLERTLE